MTVLPTWAAVSVSIGTPLLTFLGVLLAQRVTRTGAKELELRSKREEVMRNLRWAAELAVSDEATKKELGVAELIALSGSSLLEQAEKLFVDAALEAAVKNSEEELDEGGADAQAIEVVQQNESSVIKTSAVLSSNEM